MITQSFLRASVLILLVSGIIFTCFAGSLVGSDGPVKPSAYFLSNSSVKTQAAKTAELVQLNKSFEPKLLAVPVGTTVSFPNRDNIMHNVYSAEGVEGFFDLGTALQTANDNSNLLSKKMEKAGVIKLACAIHPIMQSTLFIVPSVYTVCSDNGTYAFNNIPPGSYELKVMDDKGKISVLKTVVVE